MIITKSLRVGLASFLLLCFTAAALPLDFFHDHSTEQTSCSGTSKHSSCGHKVHVSKKTSFCLICAVHFDKCFDTSSPEAEYISYSFRKLLFGVCTDKTVSESTVSYLRGPPSYKV